MNLTDAHTKIVLTFMEKIDSFTPKERDTLIQVIDIISHPIFVTGSGNPAHHEIDPGFYIQPRGHKTRKAKDLI